MSQNKEHQDLIKKEYEKGKKITAISADKTFTFSKENGHDHHFCWDEYHYYLTLDQKARVPKNLFERP